MRFYVCSCHNGETPCLFTEQTMKKLWERATLDLARCIRHGALIDEEMDATDKKAAHTRIKENEERPWKF
jgi:hypothetical protein